MKDSYNTIKSNDIDTEKTYVKVEPTYPHVLLRHLSNFVNGQKNMLKDKDTFIEKFSDAFDDNYNDIVLIKLAYDKNIIKGFFECDKKEGWRKRTIVEKSLKVLVGSVEEKYAVMLIESLMFVFNWNFQMEIERRWDSKEEDRALFHEKMALQKNNQMDIMKHIIVRENSRKLLDRDIFFGSDEDDYNTKRNSTRKQAQEAYNILNDIDDLDYNKSSQGKRRKSGDTGAESRRESADDSLGGINETGKGASQEVELLEQFDISNEKPENAKFYNMMSLKNRRMLKKAFSGNSSSQCELGDYYSEKDSKHLDYKEAVKWYSLSANKGYERAFFELGRLYDMNPSEIEHGKEHAFKIYTKMAEEGLATAQCVLGMKYWLGDGVDIDVKKAVQWLSKAADQKHDAAIRNLADLYASINDSENAQKWYKIGAATGDDYCRHKLR